MRTDYFQNMQKIYRQERLRNYRNKIIFYLGIAAFAYLGVVLSITVFKRNDSAISGQAAVAKYEGEAIKQPTTIATSTATSNSSASATATPVYRRSAGLVHHSAAPAASPLPQLSWRSTSSGSSMTVYTTSSASLKNIGGGGSIGGSTGGSSAGGIATSAFGTSTSIMVVPTLARVSSRDLTAANTIAAEAEIIDNSEAGRAAKPGIKRLDGDDDPLDPAYTPIGEGLWILLFLVAAYGGLVLYRRKTNRIQ